MQALLSGNHRVYSLATIGAGLLLVLAVFSHFNELCYTVFFNSDTLYLPSVYRDLFVDRNGLWGWHFNPAPNFFPDMPVYFLLMMISGNNLLLASFLFAVLQCGFFLFLIRKFFFLLFPGSSDRYADLACLLTFLIFLEYFFFTRDFGFCFYLIINAYHTGAFLMGLLCLLLTLRYLQSPKPKFLIALFVLSLLCSFSDRLFLVLYPIPIALVSGIHFLRQRKKQFLWLILVQLTSCVLALFFFHKAATGNDIFFDDPHKLLSVDTISSSWNTYWDQISTYMSEWGIKCFLLYLCLFSFIGLVLLWWRSRKSPSSFLHFYATFSIVYTPLVILAPILNGNYGGWDTIRYNIYPIYLGGLNSVILICFFLKGDAFSRFRKYGKQGLAGLSLMVLLLAIFLVHPKGLTTYFHYYPEDVRATDQLAQRHHLKKGVANYWYAKKIRLFSRQELEMVAVFDDMKPFFHVSNEQWFYDSAEPFRFLILNGIKDTSYIRQQFRQVFPPDSLDGIRLQATNPFHYDKKAGFAPLNTE